MGARLLGWPAEGRDQLLALGRGQLRRARPAQRPRRAPPAPGILAMSAYAQRRRRGRRCPRAAFGAADRARRRHRATSSRRSARCCSSTTSRRRSTPRSARIGNAIWLFATHPDQWDLLRQEPERVKAAFNEVLRLESPISCFTRVATKRCRRSVAPTSPPGARVLVQLRVGQPRRATMGRPRASSTSRAKRRPARLRARRPRLRRDGPRPPRRCRRARGARRAGRDDRARRAPGPQAQQLDPVVRVTARGRHAGKARAVVDE